MILSTGLWLVAVCAFQKSSAVALRVEVRGEIVVHALAESLRAEVVLHREQHVAGLAVGDAVEHLVDLVGGVGLGADGARGGLRVEVERAVFVRRPRSGRCSTPDAWRRRACSPSRWRSLR